MGTDDDDDDKCNSIQLSELSVATTTTATACQPANRPIIHPHYQYYNDNHRNDQKIDINRCHPIQSVNPMFVSCAGGCLPASLPACDPLERWSSILIEMSSEPPVFNILHNRSTRHPPPPRTTYHELPNEPRPQRQPALLW